MNRHQTLCRVNSIAKTVDTHGGGRKGSKPSAVIRQYEIGLVRRPENRKSQGSWEESGDVRVSPKNFRKLLRVGRERLIDVVE
jgi:hypothetical protein